MIGYVMVGTNDLTKATKFYDTILAPLGVLQAERTATYTAYAPNGSKDAIEPEAVPLAGLCCLITSYFGLCNPFSKYPKFF